MKLAGEIDRSTRWLPWIKLQAWSFIAMEFRYHWLVNDNNRLSRKFLRWGIDRHTIAASPSLAAEDLEDLEE